MYKLGRLFSRIKTSSHFKMKLKYGCNPDQQATISFTNNKVPFILLNGEPGYINVLDALYGYSLVLEAKTVFSKPCAASFKHTSPAGVALGDTAKSAYERARNCDPKSSFGDFIAINTIVDEDLANYIKPQVADGIIAPNYTPEAVEILKKKKQNKFIILQGTDDLLNYEIETKQFGNTLLSQTKPSTKITKELLTNIVSKTKQISENIQNDMLLSMITLRYTQSNSTCFTYDNQVIGVGAGQQSRIDCVRLARQKAEIWFLRQYTNLPFLSNIKKQDKVNATISYLQNDFSDVEYKNWCKLFTTIPTPLTSHERKTILNKFDNIVLGSDAFFPFRDSIDQASKINTKYIVQPGGSVADDQVIQATNDYKMVMVFTNLRLFLH